MFKKYISHFILAFALICSSNGQAQDQVSELNTWFTTIKDIDRDLKLRSNIGTQADAWLSDLLEVRLAAEEDVKEADKQIDLLEAQVATLGEEIEGAAEGLVSDQRTALNQRLANLQNKRKSLDLLLTQANLTLDEIQTRASEERLAAILTNRGGVIGLGYWQGLVSNINSFWLSLNDKEYRSYISSQVSTSKVVFLTAAILLFLLSFFVKIIVRRAKLAERLFIGTANTLVDQTKRLGSFLTWQCVFWSLLLVSFFLPFGSTLYDFGSFVLAMLAVWPLSIIIANKAAMRTIAPAYSRHLHQPLDEDTSVGAQYWLMRTVLLVGLISIPVCFFLGFANLGRLILNAYGTLALVLGGNLLARGYLYRVVRFGGNVEDEKALLNTDVEKLGAKAPAYVGGEILIMAASLLFVLPFFGIGLSELGQFMKDIWNGISFGPVYVQISSIVGAIIIFLLIWVMLRLLKSYLRHRVLPHTGWDEGVRDAILATITYAGFGLMFFATVNAVGMDMSRLAIVAGALSVGIGFGLQTIVSNVVSGLILLYERSIKPGDWVIVDGNVEGSILQVKVRYTEIQTFTKATVMVPNSLMVGGSVTNMTHRDKKGRVQIDVGIDYSVNPRDVLKVLNDVVADFPGAMKRPAPFVHFVGFGASSIDFAVKVYLSDIGTVNEARTNLAIMIYDAMLENDINIPFAQLDVNIRSHEILPKAGPEGEA